MPGAVIKFAPASDVPMQANRVAHLMMDVLKLHTVPDGPSKSEQPDVVYMWIHRSVLQHLLRDNFESVKRTLTIPTLDADSRAYAETHLEALTRMQTQLTGSPCECIFCGIGITPPTGDA